MKIEIVITAGVVAVVSAIFSFVCMIISWSQARDSRKNLKMQTELFEARRPNFRIKDILDSYALTELESQFVNIKMCSLITNLSDKPLTIEKVRLYVVGEEQTVVLLPVMAENCVIDGFNIPANNAARLKESYPSNSLKKRLERTMFLVLMKSRLFLGKWQNEFTSMDNGECDQANSFTIIGRVFDLRLWIVNS